MRAKQTGTVARRLACLASLVVASSLIVCGPVAASPVVYDDFNDNATNPYLWSITRYGGPTIAEANQRLEIAFPADASGGGWLGWLGAYYTSVCRFRGDYDVQVDYHLLTWPSLNGVRVGPQTTDGTWTDRSLQVARVSFSGGPDFGGYPSEVYLTNCRDVEGISATGDMSGKLRAVRTGNVVTGYYYSGGNWVMIYTYGSASTDDVYLVLKADSVGYAFTGQPVKIAFDNAIINQGQLIWPYQPPLANAGPDQTVEGNAPGGANVTLDGSGSQAPNGGPLSYLWTWTAADGSAAQATGMQPTIFVPLGATTVTLTVSVGSASPATDTVTVTVTDATAPQVSGLTASPGELWPPNSKLRDVTLTYTLTDAVDAAATATLSVTCNEDSFDAASDVSLVDATHLQLRAKRQGSNKTGRIYTITVTATDASGNASQSTVAVTVPHDQSKSNQRAAALSGTASKGRGGVVQITVQTSAAAEAEVTVCNVAGRAIARLAGQTLEPGLNTLLWNGRSQNGTYVPGGRYLVHVTARGTDGTQTNCVIPLQR